MKLSLGVENAAYSDPDAKGATTTWEVAEILEKKFHVMEVFYESNAQKIADQLADGMAKQLRTLKAGAPRPRAVLPATMEKIGSDFKRFLDAGEWESITGQSIAAAKAGGSLRFKKKKKARPAFIDTGLYQNNFRAFVKS